jgi:spermidine synthase
MNLGTGVAALLLSRRAGAVAPREAPPDTGAPRLPGRGAGLLIVLALSGASSLGLEVLWTRVLVLSLGTTTYAFVTMLASFLTGIALGGFIARSVIDRLASPRRAFGWIQVGIAASVLATLPLLGTGVTQSWLRGLGGEATRLMLTRFGVSFLIMLPATTLIGMTLPLAARIWAVRVGTIGGRLGQVYAANTLGNIAGAGLAAFVLLPALGLQRSIAVLAAAYLINAMWALSSGHATHRAAALRAIPLAIALVVGLAGILRWQPAPFASWFEQPGERVLYYREGVTATVKVLEGVAQMPVRRMTVDGITIGQSFGGVDAKQQALAHFPFLLEPQAPPRRLLSIGLGTGILVGEILLHPGVESVTCLEISSAVIEGAQLFEQWNGAVLDDSRARIVRDDGVNFLRRNEETYDAIISDAKSRTTHAANGVFFSRDYYRLCREHLAPGGVMVQWVPLAVPSDELHIILATFSQVFPQTRVWLLPPHSAFLVGSDEPLTLDAVHIDRELHAPWTRDLRRYGWRDALGFIGLLSADGESLRRALPDGTPINSIVHPVLEFYSAGSYARPPARHQSDNLTFFSEAGTSSLPEVAGADPAEVRAASRAAADLVTALGHLVRPRPRAVEESLTLVLGTLPVAVRLAPLRNIAVRALQGVLNANPDTVTAHEALAELYDAEGLAAAAARHRETVRRLRAEGRSE